MCTMWYGLTIWQLILIIIPCEACIAGLIILSVKDLKRYQISSGVYDHIYLFNYFFVMKERGANDITRCTGGLMV